MVLTATQIYQLDSPGVVSIKAVTAEGATAHGDRVNEKGPDPHQRPCDRGREQPDGWPE